MKKMMPTFSLLVFAGLTLASPSFAKVHRSCQGALEVTVLRSDDDANIYDNDFTLTELSASGGCGVLRKNECRVRARSQLQDCAEGLSDQLANASPRRPSSCTEDSGVDDYTIGNLPDKLRREVCNADDSGRTLYVRVKLTSRGNKGCHGNFTVADNFAVDCR